MFHRFASEYPHVGIRVYQKEKIFSVLSDVDLLICNSHDVLS